MWNSSVSRVSATLTLMAITLSLTSCTTVGSRESVNFSPEVSHYVSSEITRNILNYPETIYAPAGKPLYDNIAQDLINNGLDVRTSNKRTFFLARNNGFITVKTGMYDFNEALVIIDSPYFTVSQLFDYKDGNPTSKQSLLLKPLNHN